jgi:hypothetical protein
VTANGRNGNAVEETLGEYIIRRMNELEFSPSPSFAAGNIQFYKDYADTEGNVARVTIFFDKPVMGMNTVQLSNIVVNVQRYIAPEPAAIERDAPTVVQSDLHAVVQSFSDLVGHVPEQTVMARVCIQCKEESPDFYIVNGDAVCLTCVERRKHESAQ